MASRRSRSTGTAVKPTIEKGYAVITRNWKAGDKIDLVLPLKVQRVRASDKIACHAQQGRAALRPADVQHREGRSGHHQALGSGFAR